MIVVKYPQPCTTCAALYTDGGRPRFEKATHAIDGVLGRIYLCHTHTLEVIQEGLYVPEEVIATHNLEVPDEGANQITT